MSSSSSQHKAITPSKPIVLSEEQYTSAMSYIIKRDFYPDIAKLDVFSDQVSEKYPGILDLSLNQFVSKFTSEDNQSFHDILDDMQTKHSAWLDSRTIRQAVGKEHSHVETWPHRIQNSLMFPPESQLGATTTSDISTTGIEPKNTRIDKSVAVPKAVTQSFPKSSYNLLHTPQHEHEAIRRAKRSLNSKRKHPVDFSPAAQRLLERRNTTPRQ